MIVDDTPYSAAKFLKDANADCVSVTRQLRPIHHAKQSLNSSEDKKARQIDCACRLCCSPHPGSSQRDFKA